MTGIRRDCHRPLAACKSRPIFDWDTTICMTYTVDRAIALHGEGCNSGGEAPGGGVTGPDVEMISYWADLMGSVDRCDSFIYLAVL